MLFLKETWTSNMRTTTTMTLSRLSQRNQFPTRSASQFPRLSRNITSVFVCLRPCTVLSVPHEDGITVLPPMFETCEAKNLSWNLASGHSETKTASFRPCVWFFVDDSCWRAATLHLENMSLIAPTIYMSVELGVTSVHTVRRTNHTSLRQTHQNMARI